MTPDIASISNYTRQVKRDQIKYGELNVEDYVREYEEKSDLEIVVRVLLKEKLMACDFDIDMEKMSAYFEESAEVLTGIIKQYESELINTKFNIK